MCIQSTDPTDFDHSLNPFKRPQNQSQSQSPTGSAPSGTPGEPPTGLLIDIGDSSSTSPPNQNNATEAEYWLNSGRTEQNQGNSEFDQFLAHAKK